MCEALDRAGIPVVLSGGAVVSIYSDNAYESFDLDFVRQGVARKVDRVMNELGFRRQGRHWTHPDSPFWVEFPPGPVQVGDAIVSEFAELRTRVGTLRCLVRGIRQCTSALAGQRIRPRRLEPLAPM